MIWIIQSYMDANDVTIQINSSFADADNKDIQIC